VKKNFFFASSIAFSVILLSIFLTPKISHSALVFKEEQRSLELSYRNFYFKADSKLELGGEAESVDKSKIDYSGPLDGFLNTTIHQLGKFLNDIGVDNSLEDEEVSYGHMESYRIAYTHLYKKRKTFFKMTFENANNQESSFRGLNMLSGAQAIPGAGGLYEEMTVRNTLRTYELDFGLFFKGSTTKQAFDLYLYTGYGYQAWFRRFKGLDVGSETFTQEYNWGYIPVGFKVERNITNKLSISLDVAAKLITKATLQAHLTDTLQPGGSLIVYDDPGMNLGKRAGGRAEILFTYRGGQSKTWTYIFGPWIDITQAIVKEELSFVENSGVPFTWTWVEPDLEIIRGGITLGIMREF